MSCITVSETVQASVERVFEIASDLPNAANIIDGIESIETLTEAPVSPDNAGMVGLGYSWRETRIMFGKRATEDMAITKWSPPSGYSVEARSHGVHYLTDITFDPIGDQSTRMTMSFNATPETFMAKLMMKVFAFMTRSLVKCLTNDMRDIKAAAEAEADDAPSR